MFKACVFRLDSGLEETQAGIKIARRNINNLRYADDTTLMVESEVMVQCDATSEEHDQTTGAPDGAPPTLPRRH